MVVVIEFLRFLGFMIPGEDDEDEYKCIGLTVLVCIKLIFKCFKYFYMVKLKNIWSNRIYTHVSGM